MSTFTKSSCNLNMCLVPVALRYREVPQRAVVMLGHQELTCTLCTDVSFDRIQFFLFKSSPY